MEDGLLSLKWNNHKTTFFEILKVLRDKANYTDATLAVEGKFYPVHKLVLSTCSEYFSEIFERTPCKSPVIVLKDVRSQDLESLLDYMYIGEVNVNQNDLALLLKTAECLRIKGLAVPDDDPTRHSSSSTTTKPHSRTSDEEAVLRDNEASREMPPAKRRKEESSVPSNNSSPPPRVSPSTRVSSSSPPPPPPPPLTSSTQLNKSTTDISSSPREQIVDAPPLVKVEMEEAEDGEEVFQSDTNYDSNTEAEIREFTVEKAEHDPATYPNTNFSMGPTQQTGEIAWEDGENSFPPEAFGGDSSGQQAGGETRRDPQGGGVYAAHAHARALSRLYLAQSFSSGLGSGGDSSSTSSCSQQGGAGPPPPEIPFGGFPPDHSCPYCLKPCETPSQLSIHVRAHTGERPFRCPLCDYRATQKHHIKSHLVRRHKTHFDHPDPL